jgi:hypothetical protein
MDIGLMIAVKTRGRTSFAFAMVHNTGFTALALCINCCGLREDVVSV